VIGGEIDAAVTPAGTVFTVGHPGGDDSMPAAGVLLRGEDMVEEAVVCIAESSASWLTEKRGLGDNIVLLLRTRR
jgi:hypothetical protein